MFVKVQCTDREAFFNLALAECVEVHLAGGRRTVTLGFRDGKHCHQLNITGRQVGTVLKALRRLTACTVPLDSLSDS